jgi:hypothetical protein
LAGDRNIEEAENDPNIILKELDADEEDEGSVKGGTLGAK